jgi:hypothetical protein
MKSKFYHIQQQTQDFLLRLFIERYQGSTLSDSSRQYLGGYCGTYSRLRGYTGYIL